MSTETEVLESTRLRLRRHRLEDFPSCAAMWADPIVTRHIGGKPFTEEEVWARLLRYVGHWTLFGYGYWVMEDRATGEYVGELGFADFKRQLEPSIHGIPELGWALVSRIHGQGYATEAVRTALAWGDANLKSPRTVCIIDPDNQASIRVAEKSGYQERARTTYKGFPTILFERKT